jgi:hypothetical protein
MFPFQSLALYKKAQQFYLESKKILGHIKVERYINDQLGRASYSIILILLKEVQKHLMQTVETILLLQGVLYLNV